MSDAFGKNFSRLVRERGLTQKWIAAKIGVEPNTISRWKRGQHLPKSPELAALARLLGVSVDDLLASEPAKPKTSSRFPIVGRATGAGHGLAKARPGDEDLITGRIEALDGAAQVVRLDIAGLLVTIRVETNTEKGVRP